MKDDKRACIAAIAGIYNGVKAHSVYDYSRGAYKNIDVHINGRSVQLFDYDRSTYLSGTLSSLFDYGSSSYIQMNIRGNHFNGFDYETASYFDGSIRGRRVNIFDYGASTYFDYDLQ